MRFWLLALLIVLGSCGTSQRDILREYRAAFAAGEFATAAELLKKAELEKEPRSKLLLLMERGRIHYAQGDFKAAAQDFTTAIELVDQQYTKSVTREGSKWVINDASGEFFGAAYERSWLFYHQAMANFRLYQEGKLPSEEARTRLFAARAALLAWDSFFQDWQRSTEGKTLYRHDLTAKVVAAQVHEATGIRADLQIALQLYKDAWKILTTLGPAFSVFNSEADKFAGELEGALNERGEFKLPKKFQTPSRLMDGTKKLLLEKIVQLTRELRPAELPEVAKQLGVELTVLKEIAQEKRNVTFLVEEGVLPLKTTEEINLGIKGVASLAKDKKTQEQIARVGSEVVAAFAVNMLGLVPKNSAHVGRYSASHSALTLAAHEAAIAFEVPVIEKGKLPQELWLSVLDAKGALVKSAPLSVLTHLEDIARQSLEEDGSQRILRTGVRVVMKHVTAILAAMALYKSLAKGSEDNMLAKYAAVGSYVAATKGIAYSERADTRAWSTLPQTLRAVDMQLSSGVYKVELTRKPEQGSPQRLRELGSIEVSGQRAIFTYLLPQL